MPSDWKTFKPTRMPVNSKHITVRPKLIYVTKSLLKEMGNPGFIKVRVNEKLQAISMTPVAEHDPDAIYVSGDGLIKNSELTGMVLTVMKSGRVRLKAQRNPNGKSWVFQLKPFDDDL